MGPKELWQQMTPCVCKYCEMLTVPFCTCVQICSFCGIISLSVVYDVSLYVMVNPGLVWKTSKLPHACALPWDYQVDPHTEHSQE